MTTKEATKPVKKKAAVKSDKVVTTKKKTAPKEKKARTSSAELRAEILKVMKKGKQMSSCEIVLALGREPGNAGGGPVIKELANMVEDKLVKYGPKTGRGYNWIKQ